MASFLRRVKFVDRHKGLNFKRRVELDRGGDSQSSNLEH